jgi:hypothetical protein
MPNIDTIPEVYYTGLMPYRHEFDNLPLFNILTRQSIINDAVDTNRDELRDSVGSTGSLNNRLSASLNDNGSLRTAAMDAALHSIEAHEDTVDYVRMTNAERDKLALIEDEANLLTLSFETASPSSTPVDFDNGEVLFSDSSSTAWRYEAGKMFLDLAFPLAAAHGHYYDVEPICTGICAVGDYKTFKVNAASTAYVDGSLRVYINGIRLSETDSVYVPGPTLEDLWTLNSFTSDPPAGTFVLDVAITENDIIRIDFDVSYV